MQIRTLYSLVLAFYVCGIARSDELLDQGLAKMATEIKKYIDEEGLPSRVIVGDFSGMPKLKASGGVEISRSIAEQLEKSGVTVNDDAQLQLMGKFKLSEEKEHPQDDFESLALEIEAILFDDDGDELVELPIRVFGSVALQIAGKTVDVPAGRSNEIRQELLRKQVEKPPTTVEQGKTAASPTSPFAVSILVRTGNQLQQRPATVDGRGLAFLKLHLGEEYFVRLHNDATFEAAVTLTIDGVNMFIDSEDAPKDSHLVVAAGTSIDIPGWYFSRTRSKAFEIGGYEQSVANRVGNSTGVGTITASFRACWDPNGPKPSDEPFSEATSKSGLATKQGRDLDKNYVQIVRDLGAIRAVVSVRYDR